MKKQILTVLFVYLLVFKASAQVSSENLFYMTDSPDSFGSFRENLSQISIVCPQVFLISKEGVLSGSVDHRLLEMAKANHIKVMPLIVNTGFNSVLLHNIVTNPEARKRAIGMMLLYAKQYGLDGWQFDMEGLNITDRDSFTSFFKETATALHQQKLQLSAALVHTIENVGGPTAYHSFLFENWRAGYNFKELAEAGDFLSIMTYDQHTRRTPPGPVAGVDWMERIVKYLLAEGVPSQKLSLGIPNYSVHWFPDYTEEKGGFSNGQQIGYTAVQYLLGKYDAKPVWNQKAGCNYAVWDNDGVYEYIYIEDAQSLKPKLDILENYKLRGISVWVLGKEDVAFWDVLKKETRRR
ncbi:glycosyl hydrolase family 18 protein [Mucilaginibacter paludis]|uniref:Glycoside hydrolase family 18 n=1 Tax=Mucilaginibacter paludis DSM 18603 TaxID=714943 RepID=H1Y743_9SPHI|nr:glycosyl hydrolase family 18 protein [Mucilaginibacter paludis]EHQ28662.1 glycoside hydrolase family 18 [Mucilaginibacter paludis DSM 18603]